MLYHFFVSLVNRIAWSALFYSLYREIMSLKKKLMEILFDVFDMISFLVFVGGIVLFIRFFVANPYTVVGASMYPAFEENDFIVVDKITPRFGEIKRGDVIVFVPPWKTIPYIKRVIGLPWETVKIQDDNVLICKIDKDVENCEKLDQSYLPDDVETEARCGLTEFKIVSWLFVMWDNRWFSTDSRCCFGLDCYDGSSYEVPFDHIIWKVYIRFFPKFWLF